MRLPQPHQPPAACRGTVIVAASGVRIVPQEPLDARQPRVVLVNDLLATKAGKQVTRRHGRFAALLELSVGVLPRRRVRLRDEAPPSAGCGIDLDTGVPTAIEVLAHHDLLY